MFYAYAIKSNKNNRIYIGFTGNLRKRLKEHNNKQGGEYTKRNAPFELVFYEAFINKKDALESEKFFKTGYGREVLKDKLRNFWGIAKR